MCHLLLAFCENDQSVRCQITSVLMETQYFEGNKDCDLFGILKLPYLKISISLLLELILAWFWDS